MRAGVAPGGPRELAQVQRVASRRGHDRLVLARGAGGRDQRERRGAIERVEREDVELRETGTRAGRDDEQVRGHGRAADEMVEQLERGIVGPVQVIEHQHRGAHARELRREHPVGAQPRGRRPALQRDLAERVGRQRERDLALVLGGTAAQHAQPVRPLGQRVEQRALADPRLTDERHGACPARAHVGQRPVEELQLARPSDQLHGTPDVATRRSLPLAGTEVGGKFFPKGRLESGGVFTRHELLPHQAHPQVPGPGAGRLRGLRRHHRRRPGPGRSRCCSRTRRTRSSSGTAARCSTCPTRPRSRRARRSSPTSTSPASRTTTSRSSRSAARSRPNTYVIEAGKNVFGQPLYVVPQKGEMGAPVIQDRTLGAFSAWQLKPRPAPGVRRDRPPAVRAGDERRGRVARTRARP